MVTGVGFDAPGSCAAMRVGITGFVDTPFMFAGEWLVGSPVPFEEPCGGREKLLRMVVPAIAECLAAAPAALVGEIPLILCLAEADRPGRFDGLDESFLRDVEDRLLMSFHRSSSIISEGRFGGARAIDRGRQLLADGRPSCVVAGVDTLLVSQTLTASNRERRLKTADNSDGFIPGEAAGGLLLCPPGSTRSEMRCLGIGYGFEPTIGTDQPFRADGLVTAFKAAFADSGGATYADVDYRVTDVSGGQDGFKEATLAITRTLRERKARFDIWHPADCIGEVGAAIVPCMLGVALAAANKRYAPGPGVLAHVGSDRGDRAAIILRFGDGASTESLSTRPGRDEPRTAVETSGSAA